VRIIRIIPNERTNQLNKEIKHTKDRDVNDPRLTDGLRRWRARGIRGGVEWLHGVRLALVASHAIVTRNEATSRGKINTLDQARRVIQPTK
jgi:hypothetical protein